jgi:hypothetical protein
MTTIPSLPFNGQQLRDTLTALDSAIDGIDLTPGDDGREVQLQANSTHIQWRYVGDAAWTDLLPLSAITGPAGGPTIVYVHTQSTPATTWTINHNLGYRPSVELLNSGMQEIDAEIAHPSVNQVVVTLNPATAGLARLI